MNDIDGGSKHTRLRCHTPSILLPTQHSQLILRHPLNPHQFRLKNYPKHISPLQPPQPNPNGLTERAPRRNRPHSPLPVAKLRRDRQRPLITNAHIQQTLIPPLDDLPLADGKVQRLAPVVAGVELGAVGGERTAVVDGDAVTALGLAGAWVGDGVFGCDLCAEGEGEEEEG